jgi:GTPase SAR1 family protein
VYLRRTEEIAPQSPTPMNDDRLESFRSVFKNLALFPLVTPEELDRFHVEYGTRIIEQLDQLVEDCSPNSNKIVFTGHRGSGKSTLLGEFSRQLKDRYFIIFFSISDLIEMSDINHVNILFATAVKLMEEAENRGIKIGSGTKRSFYEWFSKHTKTESTEYASGIEIEAGGEAKADAWFVKFFAKLKATLKANSIVRSEIKTEFSRRITDLIDRVNDIAKAIEIAGKKEVLVIIDDLDKIDLELVDEVYRNNIQALFQPQFRIIYTIPMAAIRDMSLQGIVRSAANDRVLSMWATKFFSKGEDKNPASQPVEDAIKVFEEILYKRMPATLIEPDVTRMLILKSGGAFREFIRLASRCCSICLVELRRSPAKQDVTITKAVLEEAVKDLRIEFAEPLGQNAYEVLVEVYRNYTPKDGSNQIFLDLLHTLYVLEYRNDDLWFGVHPIVRDLLQRQGLV